MANLVMGIASGYTVEKIKPFIMSLRQHYDDYIVLFMNEVSPEMEEFSSKFSIHTCIPEHPLSNNPIQVLIDRWVLYREFLNERHFDDVENILMADTRDIVFQDNPFKYLLAHSVEFFLEPEKFKNCAHNRPWIVGCYNEQRAQEIDDEFIICAGTIMGTMSGMTNFVEVMSKEIERLTASGKGVQYVDQPIVSHLVYGGQVDDYGLNHNGHGAVATMHHSKELTFNRSGVLLNYDGTVIPVVHQYDRCGAASVIFVKRAMRLRGKAGIKEAADYVANNFFEHDIDR